MRFRVKEMAILAIFIQKNPNPQFKGMAMQLNNKLPKYDNIDSPSLTKTKPPTCF